MHQPDVAGIDEKGIIEGRPSDGPHNPCTVQVAFFKRDENE